MVQMCARERERERERESDCDSTCVCKNFDLKEPDGGALIGKKLQIALALD